MIEKLKYLTGGLQAIATMEDAETMRYLQGSGLRSIIESAAGFRSPYVLIVDDRQILASGPKLIDDLFDDLSLENKIQAATELRGRLMTLYVDLKSIDDICESFVCDVDVERTELSAVVGERMHDMIQQAKQSALELSLFALKLRKALLTPPLDPIAAQLTGASFKLYKILKHRGSIWSEYYDLAETLGVKEASIDRYLSALDGKILEHGKTVLKPRGEKKCRLESISDETIRE